MGHTLRESSRLYGNMQVVTWDKESNQVEVGIDPRGYKDVLVYYAAAHAIVSRALPHHFLTNRLAAGVAGLSRPIVHIEGLLKVARRTVAGAKVSQGSAAGCDGLPVTPPGYWLPVLPCGPSSRDGPVRLGWTPARNNASLA